MQNNEIKLKERSPDSKEAYYAKLALENAIQRSELRKLNECILRKNHSIDTLRFKFDEERAKSLRLKGLLNAVYGQVDSNFNYQFDSENPDMGNASK